MQHVAAQWHDAATDPGHPPVTVDTVWPSQAGMSDLLTAVGDYHVKFTQRARSNATALAQSAGRYQWQEDKNSHVLDGVDVKPRVHRPDYNRLKDFGEPWTQDNDNPWGHNGCDTRDNVLDRDLVDKTYVHTGKCPDALATGILHDPYTGRDIPFDRSQDNGGQSPVQIDHVVPLEYAWDMGASGWTEQQRIDFANDPDNLLAVSGPQNQAKLDMGPGQWLPPNAAFDEPYAEKFAGIIAKYHLSIDPQSYAVIEGMEK